MEYYSTLEEKKILLHATTWVNFEIILLTEISQPQKEKYYIISFIWST